jgi:hypothetical protein
MCQEEPVEGGQQARPTISLHEIALKRRLG